MAEHAEVFISAKRVAGSGRFLRQPRQRTDACQLDSPPKLRAA
jgi:hypothetical protein